MSYFPSLTGNNRPIHEFHVSKCLIDYNEQNESLQISMHIFIDDLEAALRRKGIDSLRIGTVREATKTNFFIKNYLQQKFELIVNDTTQHYTFIGKEVSSDLSAVWCYIELENITNLETITIKYTVLTEVFDDQKNMLNFKGPGKKEGYLLFDKNNKEETINF